MLLKRQVIVTSLGYCCRQSGRPPSPDCWSSCNVRGKMGEDEKGMVIEVEDMVCVQNVGGKDS